MKTLLGHPKMTPKGWIGRIQRVLQAVTSVSVVFAQRWTAGSQSVGINGPDPALACREGQPHAPYPVFHYAMDYDVVHEETSAPHHRESQMDIYARSYPKPAACLFCD